MPMYLTPSNSRGANVLIKKLIRFLLVPLVFFVTSTLLDIFIGHSGIDWLKNSISAAVVCALQLIIIRFKAYLRKTSK